MSYGRSMLTRALVKRALELDLNNGKADNKLSAAADNLSPESGAAGAITASAQSPNISQAQAQPNQQQFVQPNSQQAMRSLIAPANMTENIGVLYDKPTTKDPLHKRVASIFTTYGDLKDQAANTQKLNAEYNEFARKLKQSAGNSGTAITDDQIAEKYALNTLGGDYKSIADIYGREVTDPVTGMKTTQKLDRQRWYALAERVTKATGKLPNALVQPGSNLNTDDCINLYKGYMQDKIAKNLTLGGYAKGVMSSVFSGGNVPRQITDNLISKAATPEVLNDTRTFMANTMANTVLSDTDRNAMFAKLPEDKRAVASNVFNEMQKIGYSPKQLQAILNKTMTNTGDADLVAMMQDAAAVGISAKIKDKPDDKYTNKFTDTVLKSMPGIGGIVDFAVQHTTDDQLFNYIVNSGEDGKKLQTFFKYLPEEKRAKYMQKIRSKIKFDPNAPDMKANVAKIKSDVSDTIRSEVIKDPGSWRAIVPYWFATKGMTGTADFVNSHPVIFYGGALLALLCVGTLIKSAFSGVFGGSEDDAVQAKQGYRRRRIG